LTSCTIRDFAGLVDLVHARTEKAVALDQAGRPVRVNAPRWFWNIFGRQVVFLSRRG
jgi:hypothetical protein